MNQALEVLSQQWPQVSCYLSVPKTEVDYQQRLALIDELLDEVGEDEQHPLADILDTLSTLVHVYELDHHPEPQAEPAEVLKLLMQEHGLKQADLSEIGSQGVVSEILNGKRQLNLRQIQQLSQRFHVSPVVFISQSH